MPYQDLLTAIGPIDKIFTTLGGRSTFKARAEDGKIFITNSKGRKYNGVGEDDYNQIMDRYEHLPAGRKKMPSEYTDPNWDYTPSRHQAPWIVAIFTQA